MKSFLIIIAAVLHAALAAPQFITFKDGQVGVNFFGYHAEAGLGGGQNGNGLLGGLHASAGTPHGQNAAAGLGGNVNGRAGGLLYAGAQATPDIGASTVLGGDTSRGGFSGAESHVPGKRTGHTRSFLFDQSHTRDISDESQYVTEDGSAVQKIKHKKFRKQDNTHINYPQHSVQILGETNPANVEKSASNLPSISITKTINRATISSPSVISSKSIGILKSETATAPSSSSSLSSSLSLLSPSQSITHKLTSLNSGDNHDIAVKIQSSHGDASTIHDGSALPPSFTTTSVSANVAYDDNSNSNHNQNQNDKTTVTAISQSSSSSKTKLRNRQPIIHHPRHRVRHQQRKLQRINANVNGQRQRTKTIVITTMNQLQEQQQQQHHHQQLEPQTSHQQHDQNQLFVNGQQQIYPQNLPLQQQQQEVNTKRTERRQLIATTNSYDHLEDEEPRSYNKPIHRSRSVENALQIPVGILQSLQQSLGR